MLLLHAKQMLSTILWPFALKCYEDRIKNLVHQADGYTPFEALAGLDPTSINASNFSPFGCPCYVLDNCLQLGSGKIPKREPRKRMGIYVGRSPSHAANI
jgi:hypothetical protein